MKIEFYAADLKAVITVASQVATTQRMSILSTVLLAAKDNGLEVSATNAKLSMKTRMPNVDVDEEGSVVVNTGKLVKILSLFGNSGEQAVLETSKKEKLTVATIRLGKVKYNLNCQDEKNFPELLECKSEFFSLPFSDFEYMTNNTAFATTNEQARYFMSGVCFDRVDENSLVFAATDGWRLAFCKRHFDSLPEFSRPIVPPAILNVARVCNEADKSVQIAIEEKQIFIKVAGYTFSCPLIDGVFPNYNRVIPESFSFSLTVGKDELKSTIKRASLMTDKKSSRVFFTIAGNVLKVSANSDDGDCEEEVEIESAAGPAEPMKIAISADYVIDALNAITGERVLFDYETPKKQIKIRDEADSNTFHIVMPMTLE